MRAIKLPHSAHRTSASSSVGSGVTEHGIPAATIWTSSTPGAGCLSPGCNSLPKSPMQKRTLHCILDLYIGPLSCTIYKPCAQIDAIAETLPAKYARGAL